ncbi:hypothetical protein M5D96_008030 [Drosophila gunungcola]|uniref:Uncharacterized protein n=1 Tax=Drosophila gunungcola TaxID=103775 RepID=A0A9Q0BP12_9MUSC|nr:hypothetical protein M5D96_008030 [Drosophila gunungcola]
MLELQCPLGLPDSMQIRLQRSLLQAKQGPLNAPERQSFDSAVLAVRITIVITARMANRNLICTIVTSILNLRS